MVYITILYCLFHVQVENHGKYNYFILPISCTGGKQWYIKLFYTTYFMYSCKTMVYITILYCLFHVQVENNGIYNYLILPISCTGKSCYI